MQQPQSMLWKIAILIIALGSNVLCIRNANENDNAQISVKLKNFFPSEQLQSSAEATARISNGGGGGGFRPSQMLEFTPSDVMSSGVSRYPPSYLEPNYKHQFPSSLNKQQQAMDKQFSFPHEQSSSYELHTTPIVSYLDPYLQHKYAATPTTPSYAQYQREQPTQQGDQTYTVQSSLLVDSQAPAGGQEVYLKRPGYVFDESPNTFYRRPQSSTPATQTLAGAHKISYDSHDYPPPSYAAQQTSNFKPHYGLSMVTAKRPTQPPYNRQDIYEQQQRPLAASSIHGAASNYANNFGNYLQRPRPSYETPQQPPQQYQQPQRPAHNYYDYQIGEIPPQSAAAAQYQQQQFNYRPTPAASPAGGLATLASLFGSTQQYAPQFTNLLLGAATQSQSQSSSSPLGTLLGAFTAQQQPQQHQSHRPPNTQLIRALENIARNDDLQCVPKVLCQMIAGQTLRGQLPGFITSPAITK
ncbi:CG13699 [Drosophila busckii]|uniref:CG13699 n=1 Tax=Drosophila busckii TaxID=30019 RepID=A0A0M4EL44_DROBS|nr:CG13699 [Drosophila busckii]